MGAKANGKEKHNQNASRPKIPKKNLGGYLIYDTGFDTWYVI